MADIPDNVDLRFIAQQVLNLQQDLRDLREEVRASRRVLFEAFLDMRVATETRLARLEKEPAP